MTNCCFEWCCLLNPPLKCGLGKFKPISLECIYINFQIILVFFLYLGKIGLPFYLHYRVVKIIYVINFITSIIKLVFFIIILILRIAKVINDSLNLIVLLFCYIIYYMDNTLLSIISEILLWDELNSSKEFKEYIAIPLLIISTTVFSNIISLAFETDIQLIRFKTDLSYDEYEEQNKGNEVRIINNETQANIILNDLPKSLTDTNQNNLQNISELEKNINVGPPQQNVIQSQIPQNK